MNKNFVLSNLITIFALRKTIKMDKFTISHTILFCKGWYVHNHHDFATLWEDMKPYIERDDYFAPTSLRETVLFLVHKIDAHRDIIDDCRIRTGPLEYIFTEIERNQRLYEECRDNVWAAAFGVCYDILQGLSRNKFANVMPDYGTFEMPEHVKERLKKEPDFIINMFSD